MDGFLSPEHPQGTQGQSLHLVLPGQDHDAAQVVEIPHHHVGEHFGVGQAAGEDDGIDEFLKAAQHDANALGDLQGLGPVDQGGVLVPVLDAPLDPRASWVPSRADMPPSPRIFFIIWALVYRPE